MEAERFFREFLQLVPNDYEGATVEELEKLLPFRCSEDEKEILMRHVTEEEIRKVVFSMPTDKSLGPDVIQQNSTRQLGKQLVLNSLCPFNLFLPQVSYQKESTPLSLRSFPKNLVRLK